MDESEPIQEETTEQQTEAREPIDFNHATKSHGSF